MDDQPSWEHYWERQAAIVAAEATSADLARVAAIALRQGFVMRRDQLRRAAVPDAFVRRQLRSGRWHTPLRGVVAILPNSEAAADQLRDRYFGTRVAHAITSTAAALVRPGHVVSGQSGAVLLGLPTRRLPDLAALTARRPAPDGRRSRTLVRAATLADVDICTWRGVPVTRTARTVADLARHDRKEGVIAGDAALRTGVLSLAAFDETLRRCVGWPGVRTARAVRDLLDGRSESPLESLTRLALHDGGFPAPEPQVELFDPASRRVIRVDFLWREARLVLEADGRQKYSDDALWQEKQRELALARLGYRVERIIAADLSRERWPAFEVRLRNALRPGASRPA